SRWPVVAGSPAVVWRRKGGKPQRRGPGRTLLQRSALGIRSCIRDADQPQRRRAPGLRGEGPGHDGQEAPGKPREAAHPAAQGRGRALDPRGARRMSAPVFVVDTSALIDSLQADHEAWSEAFAHVQARYDVLAPLRVVYEVGNIVHRKHPEAFGKSLEDRQQVVAEILQGVTIAAWEKE